MAATYPTGIWDGDSPNRDSDNAPMKAPDWRDWNRMIEEVAATQTQVDTNISDIDTLEAGVTVEINTDGDTAAPNVLLAAESQLVLVGAHAGEMQFNTLPAATAGQVFTFICNDANGMRVLAASGDTIRLNGQVTISAGYVETTVVGSVVKLICLDTTEWMAITIIGTWVVETS